MHACPDGSLPPTPRWWKDDQYVVARRAAGLRWGERHELDKERQVIVDELEQLDAHAVVWMARRRAALAAAEEIHELLWPTVPAGWGRRPLRPGRSPLAPQVRDPRPIRGRSLRSMCLALLHRHGELNMT